MANNSAGIFHSHLDTLLAGCRTYSELAIRLGVTNSCLKSWMTNSRIPGIRALDRIASKIGCKTFELIKDSKFNPGESTKNDTHAAFCRNINRIFIERQCFGFAQKLSLFNGQVSDYALTSYLRNDNYKLPTLQKLDIIADSLGIYSYQLIEE